jgi:predicted ATP-dependent endonuclease of OLD family
MLSPLNLTGALNILKNGHADLPQNIKRLIAINEQGFKDGLQAQYSKAEQLREKYRLEQPSKLLIIAEGITEEKLIPVFADKSGINFQTCGVQIIGAGGKNQVARLYYDLKEKLCIPILIILDADAEKIKNKIEDVLKKKDRIFLIPDGEFEDILPDALIYSAINRFYKLTGSVSKDELCKNKPRTVLLKELWKLKGFGEFNKADFAEMISKNISKPEDTSPTMRKIINLIKSLI